VGKKTGVLGVLKRCMALKKKAGWGSKVKEKHIFKVFLRCLKEIKRPLNLGATITARGKNDSRGAGKKAAIKRRWPETV